VARTAAASAVKSVIHPVGMIAALAGRCLIGSASDIPGGCLMRVIVPIVLVLSLAAAGCGGGGQSASEKAQSQVCTATSDIQKQVDTLRSMSASTVSASAVQDAISAIDEDLQSIQDALPDLAGSRKQDVTAANQAFTSQLNSIASDLVQNLSLSQAQAQVQAAGSQLATAYKQAFSNVGC
jgi:hypothetical protein